MTIGVLKKAIENAEKSKVYPYRLGCVVFKGKRILSCGYNQIRTFNAIPDKYKKYIEALHAEQHAIMKVQNKELLNGASILVIRINRNGKLTNAKPCENCMKTILHYHLSNIYFSNENGEIVMLKKTKEESN